MRTLLTNPRSFFERRDGFGLAIPGIIVLVVGVVNILSQIPILRLTAQALPEQGQPFSGFVYVTAVVSSLVGVFVAWVLFAGAFHVIASLLYDSEGGFLETLAVTGWGYVPKIVGAVIGALITFQVSTNTAVPSTADPQQIRQVIRTVQSHPLVLTGSVIGITITLWSALIWSFAIEEVHGLSRREAVLTVAIPVGLSLVWSAYNIVTAL